MRSKGNHLLAMLLTFVITISFIATTTSAQCKNFKELPNSDFQSFQLSATKSQTKAVSVGIACGDPGLTTQQYGPLKPSTPNTCESSQCYLEGRGHVYVVAQTNLTGSLPNPYSNEANNRIIDLALSQAPSFQKHRSGGEVNRYVHSMFKGLGATISTCLSPGKSGWMEYVPAMQCVVGLLKDCGDNGDALEKEGASVTICSPFLQELGDTQHNFFPAVTFETQISTASEAAKLSTNPAVGIVPAKLPSGRPSKHSSKHPSKHPSKQHYKHHSMAAGGPVGSLLLMTSVGFGALASFFLFT